MEKITVLIVDKLSLFRVGLRQVLSEQADFKLLDCDSNRDVFPLVETKNPDVLLLDIDYPSLNGLDLSRRLVRRYPGTRVVVMSSHPDDEQLFEVTKTGAVAYLDKNVSTEVLVDTIRRAYQGEYPINDSLIAAPRVAERVLRQFQHSVAMEKTAEDIMARLTPREAQILSHIAEGMSNRQMAELLQISERTIKNHVSAVLRKLNANDRAHAVALAMRRGWISLDEEAVTASTN